MGTSMHKTLQLVNAASTLARAIGRFGGLAAATVALLALTPQMTRADNYIFNPIAGSGVALDHVDGTGTNARFFNITSVAVDVAGNVYIADGGDHTVRKVTAAGVV